MRPFSSLGSAATGPSLSPSTTTSSLAGVTVVTPDSDSEAASAGGPVATAAGPCAGAALSDGGGDLAVGPSAGPLGFTQQQPEALAGGLKVVKASVSAPTATASTALAGAAVKGQVHVVTDEDATEGVTITSASATAAATVAASTSKHVSREDAPSLISCYEPY